MGPTRFSYNAVTKWDENDTIGSILIYRFTSEGTLQAVMWHARRQIWMYAPGIAIAYLNDLEYTDRMTEMDRPEAERVAQELGTVLPTEENLNVMCEEGQRMGWTVGPPED
jgi:hypothetical protein